MSISRWLFGLIALGLGCGQPPVVVDAGSGAGDSGVSAAPPEVMLLVDTSGTMLWKAGCACTTPVCNECLPDCAAGERPRWHDILAALSGRLTSYSCDPVERTNPEVYTYDLGYAIPDYRLGAGVDQLSDGLLDRYAADVVFSLATFDSMRTSTGQGDLVPRERFRFDLSAAASGEFSFRGSERPDGTVPGELAFPTTGESHFIDTGIKNMRATEGALVLADNILADDTRTLIKEQLRRVRPYGGTPTASALDDLYFVYADAPRPSLGVHGKRYVLFITDGVPDDDFREYPSPGCDCVARGNCGAGTDLAAMRCPYPTAPDAAKHLHCGFDPARCDGPVSRIEVVTYSLDPDALPALEAVATSGNGGIADASNTAELRQALDAAISRIREDASRP